MKNLRFTLILAAFLLAGIVGGSQLRAAGTDNGQQSEKQQLEEQKKFYDRIFSRPSNELTTRETIALGKFALFFNDGNYIENGEMKNKWTEKDFVKAGFPAFLYKKAQEMLAKDNADHAKLFSVEERTKAFNEAKERDKIQRPQMVKRLADLEKKLAEEEKQQTDKK